MANYTSGKLAFRQKGKIVERIIFIDHPNPDEKITGPCVVDGWTVSPDASESIQIKVNGKAHSVHTVPRPDVEADHPGRNGKGFIFFLDPHPEINEYFIEFCIGNVKREILVKLDSETLRKAKSAIDIRAKHKSFLKTILACAQCRMPIGDSSIEGRIWACENCGENFDCRMGLDLIPESYEGKANIQFQGAICSHGYDQHVTDVIERVSQANGMVLDCGAGWRHAIHPNVITTEILRYPSTDVVSVGEKLPFQDESFDAVISLHVLEHVENPFVCAKELIRVLKPGGTIVACTPYIVGVHGFPFHFFNPTPSGLHALFGKYVDNAEISIPPVAHPVVALKELLRVYAEHFNETDRIEFRNTKIGDLMDYDTDDLLSNHLTKSFYESGMSTLAANYMITARKSEHSH
ncbi:class I SAM-dependent methyltransferase [Stappia sp.]|uniref:class I SAM-dependent methyltransferase n=1 Tax=Stappia sp. TaxID=1870903 RepID=UPI003D0CA1FE